MIQYLGPVQVSTKSAFWSRAEGTIMGKSLILAYDRWVEVWNAKKHRYESNLVHREETVKLSDITSMVSFLN